MGNRRARCLPPPPQCLQHAGTSYHGDHGSPVCLEEDEDAPDVGAASSGGDIAQHQSEGGECDPASKRRRPALSEDDETN